MEKVGEAETRRVTAMAVKVGWEETSRMEEDDWVPSSLQLECLAQEGWVGEGWAPKMKAGNKAIQRREGKWAGRQSRLTGRRRLR